MNRQARQFYWWCRDRIFPTLQSLTEEEARVQADRQAEAHTLRETLIANLPFSPDDPEKYLASVRELGENELRRQQSVDTRLTSIVGLSSIAGSVVLGTIIAGPLRHDHPEILLRAITSLGCGYLALQVCSAIAAALRGLGRRGYERLDASDILPGHEEATDTHQRRLLSTYLQVLDQNRTQNNEKVSEMAVAHCAMMNFIWGLALVAIVGGVATWFRQPEVGLVEQLKTNQNLRELFRGPRGEAGAAGPPGIPCIYSVPPAPRTRTREHRGVSSPSRYGPHW